MATETATRGTRRPWVLLAVLVAVLVVVLIFVWRGAPDGPVPAGRTAGTSNTQGRAPAGRGSAGPAEDLDVRLDRLSAARERPAEIERNPFRFEARRRAQPPGPDDPGGPAPLPEPETEPPPAGPPTAPPIPLKFIGIIESPQAGRVAALSDGRRVFQGRVGDIIEGRYRIVRIGVESIVMEYADGSGPAQTIRLSGQ